MKNNSEKFEHRRKPKYTEMPKHPTLKRHVPENRVKSLYRLSLKGGTGKRGIGESGKRGIGETGNRGNRGIWETGNRGNEESGNRGNGELGKSKVR